MDGLAQHSQRYYAVRRSLRHGDNSAFHEERKILELFSRPNPIHNHLIELLFSYEIGADQFMIFPWSECNLREFWEKHDSPAFAEDDLIWLIRQCRGLADALCEINRYYGTSNDDGEGIENGILSFHGDIKPENILFFGSEGQRGRLVISDFQIMTHNVNSNGITAYSVTYRPPELDGEIQATQKCDVWSLGCVFLEFVIWRLLGYTAIHSSFTDARIEEELKPDRLVLEDKFFTSVDHVPENFKAWKVKDSVRQVRPLSCLRL